MIKYSTSSSKKTPKEKKKNKLKKLAVKNYSHQQTSNKFQGSPKKIKKMMKDNPNFAKAMGKYYNLKEDDIKY